MKKYILFSLCIVPLQLLAQNWKAHDLNRAQPEIVKPAYEEYSVKAPSDAIFLFDGTNFSDWVDKDGKPSRWLAKDDYFECVKGTGYIYSKKKFGDVQLHIEWATPSPAHGTSQDRGNSGVFLMGKYEVQVLDSYQNITYPDGQAGAVYGQYPPLVNASLPPGHWQAYDIIFRRPHFSSLGYLEKPARITVFHNGILVQDNVKLWGETEWLQHRPYKDHPDRLPLALQDHDHPVRYRNIWVRDLEREAEAKPDMKPVIRLTEKEMANYTGTYIDEKKEEYKIYAENENLMLSAKNRDFILIAHSKDTFSAKTTAIDLTFDFDTNGKARAMIYEFTGNKTKTVRK
jgi:3-keto-disaccharide hydrolase/Domain of unknown function (DUF3471)